MIRREIDKSVRPKWRHEFTVEGPLGTFPHDMLRYDACWPRDEGSARDLDQCSHGVPGTFQITLIHESAERDWSPTVARWQSFGWRLAEPRVWDGGGTSMRSR